MRTEFHSMITTQISWRFGPEVDSWTMQQMHHSQTPATQAARACFRCKLVLLMTVVSQARSRVMKTVMLRIMAISTTKKMTAQGPCRGPVSLPSMVPMVTPQQRMEPMARQNWYLGGTGYPTLLACCSTHLKITKKMSARKDELMSITQRKTMSWGQWQAVLVTVACGQGGSSFLLTAMWYVYRGVTIMAGTSTQMILLRSSFPKPAVFIFAI